jgi:hypothetical protein
MDIKTFVQIASLLPANISILVKGDTGIGKSEVVREIAAKIKTDFKHKNHTGPGLPIIDWRLSAYSEGDVIGLPELVDNTTRFAPNNRFIMACKEPHLLFLDEGNRASQEVLKCVFQIVLDRELEGHVLHPETRIVMAINEGADFTVNEMDPALLRRFWVTELTPTTNDWLTWATKNNVDRMICKFIEKYPAHLMHAGNRSPDTVYPYPASWARLDRSLKHAGFSPTKYAGKDIPEEIYLISAGFIGMPTSIALIDFIKNYSLKLNAEDVLNKFDDFILDISEMSNDKKNDLLDIIVEFLKTNEINVNQMQNLVKFLNYVSDEVIVNFSQDLMGTKNLHNIKLITPQIKSRIIETVQKLSKATNDRK